MPLIRALAVGSDDEVAVIRHAIGGGGLTDFAPVVAALERTGALAYARETRTYCEWRGHTLPDRAAAFAVPGYFATIDSFRGGSALLIRGADRSAKALATTRSKKRRPRGVA